ncbi:hypothetical protein [Qipengyuania sp. ASV99]|uniref:hypothetical protein n=1 Tax=Qipengyuania sp. ASV99 TaxID=3399681 RepID=UPI003A4C535A
MDDLQFATAEACQKAACDDTLSFPEIIGKLASSGFEGYAVDYRRSTQIYYTPDGTSAEFALLPAGDVVAADFDSAGVQALVRWAQSGSVDYTYADFCAQAKAAGCAGYLASFSGRRVVYYGRTAETHVEHFPQ